MRAVQMLLPLEVFVECLHGRAHIENIPAGAAIDPRFDFDVDEFTQRVSRRVVLKIQHESLPEVRWKIPTVEPVIIQLPARKPASREHGAIARKVAHA